jgi:hypothetical protein
MFSPEVLTTSLNDQGLHFIVGESPSQSVLQLLPAEILAGLAEQSDARLRMAIIALLLYRPAIAAHIPSALNRLDETGQLKLKLFYTAAVFLQQIHAERLRRLITEWQTLPDFFSQGLGLPQTGTPQERLFNLSQLHRRLSGLAANWLGTYLYTAERLITRLEKEILWAT